MRRIAKRIDLEGVLAGWDAECFALVAPADYQEFVEFQDAGIDKMNRAEGMKYQNDFVKAHLLSGKGKFLNENNEFVLDDLVKDDIDASRDLSDKLFLEIVGINLDPKVSSTSTAPSTTTEATSAA